MHFVREIRFTCEMRCGAWGDLFHFTSTRAVGGGRYFTISEGNYFTFGVSRNSSHFRILQRTGTSRWLNICPCDDRSPCILRLSSFPFCKREKIPYQFVLQLWLLDSCVFSCQLAAEIDKFIFLCYYAILRRAGHLFFYAAVFKFLLTSPLCNVIINA